MAPDGCKSIGRLLGAHLDGELDAVKTLEVEEHLGSCETCCERLSLDRALRGSIKKTVSVQTPDDVRARMLATLERESARAAEAEAVDRSESEERGGMLRHWRTMLPLASAAALALAWGAASKQPLMQGATDVMRAGFGNEDLLRDFVAQHSRPLPPEQTDPTQVQKLERYVGVPVRVPRFTQNAHFVGGRLVPVHGGERAAMLQYELAQSSGGVQRVTIFVYNPRAIHVGTHLAPRAVGTAEVRVGQTDGYSVAVTQRGGVGFAIASDLDPESSAQLALAADAE